MCPMVDRVKNFNGLVLATRGYSRRGLSADPRRQNASCRALHPRHLWLGDPGGDRRAPGVRPIDKPTFGSETLGKVLKEFNKQRPLTALHWWGFAQISV